MTLNLKYVRSSGDLEKERLVFSVSPEIDLGDYCILQSEQSEDGGSWGAQPAFWFPEQKIGAGDTVVLYSKKGQPKVKENSDKSKSYFYYWGATTPLWTKGKAVVQLHTDAWDIHTTDDQIDTPNETE